MQHKRNVNGDLGIFGTYDKWDEGANYYFNYIYNEEDKEINNYVFYEDVKQFINKFNMIFMKPINIKRKIKNIVEITY